MTPHFRPVDESERIAALDVLRGFAVLAILVMNIQAFSMPMISYINPSAYGWFEGANWWIWLASHVLADRKFITIFSMLFGAGIYLFTSRIEARDLTPGRLHYRRMFWLLLFGLAHAHLLWFGDILFSYAVCGMLVYPFRKLPPERLLIFGLLAAAVGAGIYIFFGATMDFWPPEVLAQVETENWRPPPERLAWEVDAYRGGWLEQMQHRVPTSFFMQTQYLLMYELWRAAGLMLVGMALFKWGVLSGQRSRALYRLCIVAGVFVGIPLVLYGVYRNVQAGWSMRYSFFFGPLWNYWASILVSLAWIGVVVLVCRSARLAPLTYRLAAVGRMAFSNYILQTLICTTLFYGHGFGLFGRVERLGQLLIVLVVTLIQLVVSPLWLRHFRLGPLEWAWRSLTYGERQPFRRAHRPAAG